MEESFEIESQLFAKHAYVLLENVGAMGISYFLFYGMSTRWWLKKGSTDNKAYRDLQNIALKIGLVMAAILAWFEGAISMKAQTDLIAIIMSDHGHERDGLTHTRYIEEVLRVSHRVLYQLMPQDI